MCKAKPQENETAEKDSHRTDKQVPHGLWHKPGSREVFRLKSILP